MIALIGARAGSKSIPDKNIQDLGGKPLLAWSIETAKAIKSIREIIVSTDSRQYAGIAEAHGARVILRPAEFAQDDSPDYGWVNHLFERVPDLCDELLILLRPTTPLRDPFIVINTIACFRTKPEATSLRSVHEMAESAWKFFQISNGYLFSLGAGDPHLPRQHYRDTYQPNGYVDILRGSHILKHHNLYGDRILAYKTPRVTEVDSPEELEYLRWKVNLLDTLKRAGEMLDAQEVPTEGRLYWDPVKMQVVRCGTEHKHGN